MEVWSTTSKDTPGTRADGDSQTKESKMDPVKEEKNDDKDTGFRKVGKSKARLQVKRLAGSQRSYS